MAAGLQSNFVVYDEEYYSGMAETVAQNLNVFNTASRNTIRLTPRRLKGNFLKEAFFDDISGAIARRDNTDNTSEDDVAMTSDEIIGVKFGRRFQIAQSLDALEKIAFPTTEEAQREVSFQLGKIVGARKLQNMIDTALIAAETAIESNGSSTTHEAAGTSIVTKDMVQALKLFGDNQASIRAWAIHSGPFFDVMVDQLDTYKVDSVAGQTIQEGTAGTLGRPVIVTDSTALTDGTGSGITYNTLGLVQGAVDVFEGPERMVARVETGGHLLKLRVQGEFDFTVRVKGYEYTGTANPTDGTLGTITNWAKVVTHDKNTAGVRIKSTD